MAFGVSKRANAQVLKPKLKPSLPISHPIREAPKPQVTISTSKILRRKPLKEVYGKRHSVRHKRSEPEHEVFLDYQEEVEASRKTLLSLSYSALNDTHEELTKSLNKLHVGDTAFHDDIDAQCKQLLLPLTEETVETTFTRDGKSITEILHIGRRVEAFKATIAKQDAELKQHWLAWEQVQRNIIELGVGVFGAEAFEGLGADNGGQSRGYKNEMEMLDLEHQAWLEEMDDEIQLLGQESLKKLMAAEKELDAHLKKDQAIFFAQMFAEED